MQDGFGVAREVSKRVSLRLRPTDQQIREAAAVTGGLAAGTGLAATAYELHEHAKSTRRTKRRTPVRKGLRSTLTTRDEAIGKFLRSPKTTLEQRQKQNQTRYMPQIRAVHNMYGGVDVANLADTARATKAKEFTYNRPSAFLRPAKEVQFAQVKPGVYRQKDVDPRRFSEIDRVYGQRKNLPKGETVAYYEGRKGRVFPGMASALTHKAEESKTTDSISFNTHPVWFNRKTKGRVNWEKFAAHHELGHAGDMQRTGKQMWADQINGATNVKGRRAKINPQQMLDVSAKEEGLADRHGLQMTRGLGRKGDQGAYESNLWYSSNPEYWKGRNSDERDKNFRRHL